MRALIIIFFMQMMIVNARASVAVNYALDVNDVSFSFPPSYGLRGGAPFPKIEAKKLGVSLADGEFVNVLINMTGNVADPKTSLKFLGTDGEGMATIQLDEKPFVVVASNGSQRGFIRLRDGESMSLSKFDVSGSTVQKGVKGFVYTERGVWRPGDSVYLTFMIEDKNEVLPTNHPVEFTLHNPKNQLITRKVSTQSLNGLYDFRTTTTASSLTGNYRAEIKVGNRKFVRYLKIETVKPNRLKVILDTKKSVISKSLPIPFLNLRVKALNSLSKSMDSKWAFGLSV